MRTLTEHIVEGDAANHQLTITVTDEPGAGGANHRYYIEGFDASSNPSCEFDEDGERHGPRRLPVYFQSGPIKEAGVNGVTDQSLVVMVIDRYRGFQSGPYASEDNAEALAHLEAFMECSRRRTKARIARGVEGTHTI